MGGDVSIVKNSNFYNLIYDEVTKYSCVNFISKTKPFYNIAKISNSNYISTTNFQNISKNCSEQDLNNLSISFLNAVLEYIKNYEDVKNFLAENVFFLNSFAMAESSGHQHNQILILMNGETYSSVSSPELIKSLYINA